MNHLKKITPLAKRLYKTGRYKKYSDAVKAAFNKIPAKKHKAAKPARHKKTVKRTRTAKPATTVNLGVGTISGHSTAIRILVKEKLDKAVLRKYHAKTARDKRRYQKEITELKKEYKRFSK